MNKTMPIMIAIAFGAALLLAIVFRENTAVTFSLLFAAFACVELFIEWAGIQGLPKLWVATIAKAVPVLIAILYAAIPNL